MIKSSYEQTKYNRIAGIVKKAEEDSFLGSVAKGGVTGLGALTGAGAGLGLAAVPTSGILCAGLSGNKAPGKWRAVLAALTALTGVGLGGVTGGKLGHDVADKLID